MFEKKKILILGSNHVASLERIYLRSLIDKGYEARIFAIQDLFFIYYNKSIFNKIIYRIRLSNIIEKIQKSIKITIIEFKPSYILVFKGMEVTTKTLIWIKNNGIKIYNYNPDHPFIFSGKGSGNKNVTNSVSLFDYYFSYANDVVESLNQLGIKSKKIPFGFDVNGFDYNELKIEDEILKICFLGNADKQRAKFINELARQGLDIDVYGENWIKFNINDSIQISSAKYGEDFWKTLQKYAVQLNLLRPHNLNTHNMRSFDIPGAGGIMLAPLTDDHLTYFENRTEVFLYKDLNEAYEISKQILGLSFEERNTIRLKARKRAFNEHGYNDRITQFLKYIGE